VVDKLFMTTPVNLVAVNSLLDSSVTALPLLPLPASASFGVRRPR